MLQLKELCYRDQRVLAEYGYPTRFPTVKKRVKLLIKYTFIQSTKHKKRDLIEVRIIIMKGIAALCILGLKKKKPIRL